MVTISSLWLPILISAVGVWLMSVLVWVVLPHHKLDYKALPDEAAAQKPLHHKTLNPGSKTYRTLFHGMTSSSPRW